MLLLTLHINAVDNKGVQYYVKKYMETKMHSPVDKIETLSSYEIGNTNGWEVYFLSLDMRIKMGKVYKKRTVPQIVFTKGNKITFSLKDEHNTNYAKLLKPKVPEEAYDDTHLLVGNKNALHKLLVMSDPFCPYCQEIVPEMIDLVKKNPDTFALYYYHLPLLRIHPASDVTTRVMYLLHEDGEVEKLKKLYHLVLNPRETNTRKILRVIKKKIGMNFTVKQLNASDVKKTMDFDRNMKKRLMVTGTPTVFIDGFWDPTRLRYKEYLK